MLQTRERTLLLETLRPPAGYRLQQAVGTSYTLDLIALLTAPLAFTFFDVHDEDGKPTADPVALLEALRAARREGHPLLPGRSDRRAEARSGAARLPRGFGGRGSTSARGGIFHPKVWVLGFASEGKPPIYRLLCLSRNLTFDRAWDTCLCLEGPVTEQSSAATRRCGSFSAPFPGSPPAVSRRTGGRTFDGWPKRSCASTSGHRLPSTTSGSTPSGSWRAAVALPRRWPKPCDLPVPRRVDDRSARPRARPRRPDLTTRGLGGARGRSPPGALLRALAAALGSTPAKRTTTTRIRNRRSPMPGSDLTGLHAKLFLFETGPRHAALHRFGERDAGRLRAQRGASRRAGRRDETLRHRGADGRRGRTRRTARCGRCWSPTGAVSGAPDDVGQAALERRLELLTRYLLASSPLTATVADGDQEGSRTISALSGSLPDLPARRRSTVWPADARRQSFGPAAGGFRGTIASFPNVSFEALTCFFAFEISAREAGLRARRRFTVTAALVGAPDDRRDRLLRSFLNDSRQVLRLLLLLLMDEDADVSRFVAAGRQDEDGSQLVRRRRASRRCSRRCCAA